MFSASHTPLVITSAGQRVDKRAVKSTLSSSPYSGLIYEHIMPVRICVCFCACISHMSHNNQASADCNWVTSGQTVPCEDICLSSVSTPVGYVIITSNIITESLTGSFFDSVYDRSVFHIGTR